MSHVKTLLAIAAAGEALTGLVLAVYPLIVVRLLLGAEVAGIGVVISRVAGISLIALGVACWPDDARTGPLRGMLTYTTLVALYLMCLGIGREWAGILLWPAVVVHVILAALLLHAAFRQRRTTEAGL